MLTASSHGGVRSYDLQRQTVRVMLHGRTLIRKPWQRRSKKNCKRTKQLICGQLKTAAMVLVGEKCSHMTVTEAQQIFFFICGINLNEFVSRGKKNLAVGFLDWQQNCF